MRSCVGLFHCYHYDDAREEEKRPSWWCHDRTQLWVPEVCCRCGKTRMRRYTYYC